MAENSKISWTDHTFNAWIGCTKVGPGCDLCYAAALDSARRWENTTHWGPGVPRKVMADEYWRQPYTWNRKAEAARQPTRVFCSSLADVFDNEAPEGQRARLWRVIEETPWLDWILVTKRIGNAVKMIPQSWHNGYPPNVWLLATIVNQQEAERDLDKLFAEPAYVRGVSYEPALGYVNWRPWLKPGNYAYGIDWLIIGGESEQEEQSVPMFRDPADFQMEWAFDMIDAVQGTLTVPHVKQLGARPHLDGKPFLTKAKAGKEPSEWPGRLRVQLFPNPIARASQGALL